MLDYASVFVDGVLADASEARDWFPRQGLETHRQSPPGPGKVNKQTHTQSCGRIESSGDKNVVNKVMSIADVFESNTRLAQNH